MLSCIRLLFFEKAIKVAWVGRGKDLKRYEIVENCDQIYLNLEMVLNDEKSKKEQLWFKRKYYF